VAVHGSGVLRMDELGIFAHKKNERLCNIQRQRCLQKSGGFPSDHFGLDGKNDQACAHAYMLGMDKKRRASELAATSVKLRTATKHAL